MTFASSLTPKGTPIRTPWGPAQNATSYAPGITFYSTAGHGGFKLDRAHNAKVPAYLRCAGGWYEEDVEANIVVLVFPEAFSEGQRNYAHRSIRDYYPHEYARLTGKGVDPAESRTLRREAAEIALCNRLVVFSARVHSRHAPDDGIPAGFVRATAARGLRRNYGQFASAERHVFLVPEADYEPGEFGFVIPEPTPYEEIEESL